MLRKVTFSKLLFEIDNAEYVDRLPVKLHDGEFLDVAEVDYVDLFDVDTRSSRSTPSGLID